jgi:hypothetical protein
VEERVAGGGDGSYGGPHTSSLSAYAIG